MIVKNYHIVEPIAANNGVQLYLLNIPSNLRFINEGIIPLSQLEAINMYRAKRDREKRLLARSFLYELIYQNYNIDNFDIRFNQFHKPFFKHYPDIYFSFSYSEDYVFIALSRGTPVGVDIQRMDNKFVNEVMAGEIMCMDELELFHAHDDNALLQRKFFFSVFSSKEAIIKAFGMGLHFPIKEISTLASRNFSFNGSTYHCSELQGQLSQHALTVCHEVVHPFHNHKRERQAIGP
jgi:4'-phosphopantetheinyl transferase